VDIRWHEIQSVLTEIQAALALVFVIEGLLLFGIPHRLKKTYLLLLTLPDLSLRIVGLCLMVVGLFLLMVVR